MKQNLKSFIALIAGVLSVFAFAPYAIRSLAFVSPALLLWCLIDAGKRSAFIRGLLYGFGLFGVGAYWVYISIHTFGEAPIPIALIITFLFIFCLALFTAVMTWLFTSFKCRLSFLCLAIFPSLWVSFEWLRSWVLSGFPWLFIGYSQVDTQLSSFAPIVGVYGLSFLVVFVAGAFVVLVKGSHKEKWAVLACLALLWTGSKALSQYHSTTILSKLISVSLIQGNIPQSLKWNAEQAARSLKLYEELSRSQAPGTIIIWPEAAIPIFKSNAAKYLSRLNTFLKKKNQILISGIPIDHWPNFYNGILMLGKAQGEYLKVHLVPFGEYYPLKWLLSPLFDYLKIPMSDLTPGLNTQPLLEARGIEIAPFVCYEIAFPQQILTQAKEAQLLISLSDDSWFGDSIAAAQHLEIAQLRAMETQRYLLFSTNSGISAVINPQGKLIAKLPMDQQGIVHAQIRAVEGSTPLMRWGYAPLAALIILLVLLGCGSNSCRLFKRRG